MPDDHGARAVFLMLMVLAGCSSSPSVKAPSVTFGPGRRHLECRVWALCRTMPNMPAGPAAPTAGSATPEAGNAVNIDNFAFAPTTLTVPTGSTVTGPTETRNRTPSSPTTAHFIHLEWVAGNVFLHLHDSWQVRLCLLDPPVHACHRGGDEMTDAPHTMNRRQLIRHSAWFGAAVGLAVVGGEVISHVAGTADAARIQGRPTRVRSVSDSHIGFMGKANPNVAGSFGQAIDRSTPRLHAGFRHPHRRPHPSGHPGQFDQVKQMLTGLRTPHVFTVPGGHDSVDDAGQKYRSAFGAGTRGDGWYSFDIAGVHVIALVNTLNLKARPPGCRPARFVARDVAALPSDTPIIVFSHIPLFAMYPDWGWGTDDAAQALSSLRRFSSVTCLNGHVHQLSPDRRQRDVHSGTTPPSAARSRRRSGAQAGHPAGRQTA